MPRLKRVTALTLVAITIGSLFALSTVPGPGSAQTSATETGPTEITSCTTIDSPGSYVLADDIYSEQEKCIAITADDVVFDGNGHTIDSNGEGERGISASGDNVTVRDVVVTDWDLGGVVFDGVSDGTIRGVAARYNRIAGIYLLQPESNMVEGNTATNNTRRGIAYSYSVAEASSYGNGTYANNVVSGNGGGLAGGPGSTLTNNTATGNDGYGLVVGEGGVATGNLVVDSGAGISAHENATATGNTVENNSDVGIGAQTGARVANNRVASSDVGVEIRASDNATVAENTFVDNRVGVRVEDANQLSVIYSKNNTIAGNDISGGEYGVEIDASENVVRDNTITNTRHAVRLQDTSHEESPSDSKDNRIAGNTISDARVGVFLDTYGGQSVVGNEITNVRWGVDVRDSFDDDDENTPDDLVSGVVSENVVSASGTGVALRGEAAHLLVANNSIHDNTDGVRVEVESPDGGNNWVVNNTIEDNEDGVDVRFNRGQLVIRGNTIRNSGNGIHVVDPDLCGVTLDLENVRVHSNAITGSAEYGVLNEGETALNATGNYWGAEDGPSSPAITETPLEDPVTGTLANGSGGTISEGPTEGVSNVHFDPWLSQPVNQTGTTG